ncbi:hypothetical protein QFC22_005715 [Naganishia vaughanmartiniae]|uniref:Uncharacterized protein n=1 Tax=Naganishia vaughanmartiniae TaxID=1424756 RepID=A0ACC2WR64_9TREE|nr:hypothetical protein QFC22_005715 [Naganishia vaughanmartiniae]
MPHEPTALIIVDVQNDFLPPTGSLAVPDGREILPPIYKLLSDEEWDWHPPGHVSFASSHQDGKPYTKIQISASSGTTKSGEQTAMRDMFIWPDHCVPGTPGAEIEDGLQERLKPWLANKKLVVVRKVSINTDNMYTKVAFHGYEQGRGGFYRLIYVFVVRGGRATTRTLMRFQHLKGLSSQTLQIHSPYVSSSSLHLHLRLPLLELTHHLLSIPLVPSQRTDEAKPTGPDIGSYLLEKGIKRCIVVGLATDYWYGPLLYCPPSPSPIIPVESNPKNTCTSLLTYPSSLIRISAPLDSVAQTTLSAVSYPSTHSPGEKAFKTFVYTPATRGVNQDDSAKALAGMRERGAVLVDEDGLRRVLEG